jgi:phenylalanyl-tRNA synthetase beta chain
MKFSLQWLRKYLDFNVTPEQLAQQLTNIGLEVEGIAGDELEISVPPNRADCLGIIGIARKTAAVNGLHFAYPEVATIVAKVDDKIRLEVKNPTACPRYCSRIIKGINNHAITPAWIQDCLRIAGINVISPVVDITNFVMLEWGQPLHAFDLNHIHDHTIVVRNANKAETLTLLDEEQVELDPEILVIADPKQALAVAGIKGGLNSGINADTKDIVLECAYFDPIKIRLAARRLGLQTDSSYRFERAIDPGMQVKVLERVTQLLLEVVGGNVGPIIGAESLQYLPESVKIPLRLSRIKRVAGIEISVDKVTEILKNLGMVVEAGALPDDFIITVPEFRTDMQREIDLIEEVVRIYGYDNIPAQLPIGTLAFTAQPEELVTENHIVECLINRGYNEAITYSFIDPELSKLFFPAVEHTRLVANPISVDMSVMRPSLLPGLVNAVLYNQNRQQDRLRFFEIGLRFTEFDNNLEQVKTIAGACSGNVYPEGWANAPRAIDLYDIKEDVMALFALGHNTNLLNFRVETDVALHPGQCAGIYLGNARVGKIGLLHPALQQRLGLNTPVYLFEVDFVTVISGKVANFSAFSKYPAVRRDIAILVAKEVASANIVQAIQQTAGKLLQNLVIFDVYQGKGIEPGFKSMALGITLQDLTSTLTDATVNDIFERVVSILEKDFNAKLR